MSKKPIPTFSSSNNQNHMVTTNTLTIGMILASTAEKFRSKDQTTNNQRENQNCWITQLGTSRVGKLRTLQSELAGATSNFWVVNFQHAEKSKEKREVDQTTLKSLKF